jgi:hypothetical protein
MIDLTAPANALADHDALLEAITRAYGDGDAPYGELLFSQALDDGLPWDEACAAAARGIAHRFGQQPHE